MYNDSTQLSTIPADGTEGVTLPESTASTNVTLWVDSITIDIAGDYRVEFSEAVVTAMIEYIQAHPEVLNKDNPVKVIAACGYSENTLNERIEAVVRRIAGTASPPLKGTGPDNVPERGDAKALDTLLDSLGRFE